MWDDAGDDYLFDPDEERIEYEERSAARELRRGGGGWEDGPGGRGGWEEPSPGARPGGRGGRGAERRSGWEEEAGWGEAAGFGGASRGTPPAAASRFDADFELGAEPRAATPRAAAPREPAPAAAAAAAAEAPPAAAEAPPAAAAGAEAADVAGAAGGEDDARWLQDMERDLQAWGAPPARAAARGAESRGASEAAGAQSRADYVEARLARLAANVAVAAERLQEEEDELAARCEQVRTYRQQLQQRIEGPADWESAPMQNGQLTAREADLGRLASLSSQLRVRRTALWAELDEAQSRGLELQKVRRAIMNLVPNPNLKLNPNPNPNQARRALSLEGLRGLRQLVISRQLSRNLRTYLERLLGPVN